jgi:hypothetical protein
VEILDALRDETARQMKLLDAAIREQDVSRCVRRAHIPRERGQHGQTNAAEILKEIETKAAPPRVSRMRGALVRLAATVDPLRSEAVTL